MAEITHQPHRFAGAKKLEKVRPTELERNTIDDSPPAYNKQGKTLNSVVSCIQLQPLEVLDGCKALSWSNKQVAVRVSCFGFKRRKEKVQDEEIILPAAWRADSPEEVSSSPGSLSAQRSRPERYLTVACIVHT